MIVSASDLLAPDNAPVAAFNVITLEHAEAIAWASENARRPVIMQLSENAIRFHRGPWAIAAAMRAVAETASTPIALHLDHITDPALARMAVDLGFSSVMFDAAHLEYDENVVATAEIVRWGRENGIWVEAELGEIGGKDGAHAPGVRTDPAEAASFVAATDVDALAVAVGSSHAMTSKEAKVDIDLIARIAAAVDVPLVLHGSSGVPDDLLRDAAAAGMRKINIGTALNTAFTGVVRAGLEENPTMVDPRKYLGPGRGAMTDTCAHYLQVVAGG